MSTIRYEQRSGQLTALNAAVTASTRFTATSSADYVAQAGQILHELIYAVAADGAVVGAASFSIRLGGGGMPEELLITAGAIGGTLATTNIAQAPAIRVPLKMPVVLKQGTIQIQGNMSEVDIGSAAFNVTIVIEVPG